MKKSLKSIELPVLIEKGEDGYFIGSVPSLRSCYTQGKTLAELYKNLEEVVALSLETEAEFFGKENLVFPETIGFQKMSFALS